MAHRLKPQISAISDRVTRKVAQGGASMETRKQGRGVACPLYPHFALSICATCSFKVAQRWRKVSQQGGRCATHGDTPKGVFPGGQVAQSPGPFAGWSRAA